ncbi:MAG: ABC transporter permease [Inquilinaceae bacterium]
MTPRRAEAIALIGLAVLLVATALAVPAGMVGEDEVRVLALGRDYVLLALGLAALGASLRPAAGRLGGGILLVAAGVLFGLLLLLRIGEGFVFAGGLAGGLVFVLAVAVVLWLALSRLAHLSGRGVDLAVPILFGALLIYLWEVLVRGFEVPPILLPAPGAIAAAMAEHRFDLWTDFVQTFLKSVIPGFIIGSGAGFLTAVAIDRSPFLQRGLLPLGSLISAMPIVGIAPIMVMWFGFDWQSKAAVVVVMTFFPMMVNTLAGLQSAGVMERDLMRSYAAGYRQTLLKLRLPGAMPFVFNALKLNSTLALIGAIVAEFFGTPIYGMGFRIATEIGRFNVDLVWATIVVAAVAGSASYGGLALLERRTTFWHPSHRNKQQVRSS